MTHQVCVLDALCTLFYFGIHSFCFGNSHFTPLKSKEKSMISFIMLHYEVIDANIIAMEMLHPLLASNVMGMTNTP